MGLHPLVCSLIAESHPLHEIVRLVWTATTDTTKKRRAGSKMKREKENILHFLILCLIEQIVLPSICVRDGVCLLRLHLVEQGGEDPPGLLQLVAGTERGAVQVKKQHIKNNIHRQ